MPKEITQAFLEHSAKLASFKKHPAWPEYIAALDEMAESTKRLLLTHLLAGESPSLNKVYYARGVLDTLRKFKSVVETAEDTVERSLRESNIEEA